MVAIKCEPPCAQFPRQMETESVPGISSVECRADTRASIIFIGQNVRLHGNVIVGHVIRLWRNALFNVYCRERAWRRFCGKDGRMHEWVDEWIDWWMHEWVGGWIDWLIDEWVGGWMDGWFDWLKDEWIDGRMDKTGCTEQIAILNIGFVSSLANKQTSGIQFNVN